MEGEVHAGRRRFALAIAVLLTLVPPTVWAASAYWRVTYRFGEIPVGDYPTIALAGAYLAGFAGLQAAALWCSWFPKKDFEGWPKRLAMVGGGLTVLSLVAMGVSAPVGGGLIIGAVVVLLIALSAFLGSTIGVVPATLLSFCILLGLSASVLPSRDVDLGFEVGTTLLAVAAVFAFASGVWLVVGSWRDAGTWRALLLSPEFAAVARFAVAMPVSVLAVGVAIAVRDMEDPAASLWIVWLAVAWQPLLLWLILEQPRKRRVAFWILVPCVPAGAALLFLG